MTQKEKLIELLETIVLPRKEIYNVAEIADFMIDFGVVVLPCKVGDTAYRVWYAPCHLGETYPDGIGCDGCLDSCDIHKVITEVKAMSLNFIVDKFMSAPQNVYFVNREEAEAALKKMEDDK